MRPGAQPACPSTGQVTEALKARLPGAVVPFGPGLPAQTYTIELSVDGAGAPVLSVLDGASRRRLRRPLPAPEAAHDADCLALADTVALIIQRFMQAVDLGEPPADATAGSQDDRPGRADVPKKLPTQLGSAPWEIALGGGFRPGDSGPGALQLTLGAGLRVGPLRFGLAAGAALPDTRRWTGGSAELRRFPVQGSALWRTPAGLGELQGGAFIAGEILALRASAGRETQSELRVVPIAGLGAGYRIPLGARMLVRLLAQTGVALVRYEFVPHRGEQAAVFSTDRIQVGLGMEVGLALY